MSKTNKQYLKFKNGDRCKCPIRAQFTIVMFGYYVSRNDKNYSLSIVIKNCKNHKKVILLTITSSKCQRDAE